MSKWFVWLRWFAPIWTGFLLACMGHSHGVPSDAWQDLGYLPTQVEQVTTLAPGEHGIYVGTKAGVWFKPVSGEWKSLGLTALSVNVIRVAVANGHEQILVGGEPRNTGDKSFFRSPDEGTTWIPVASGLQQNTGDWASMKDLAIQPNPTGTPVLFATMRSTSVARSMDFGITWEYVKGTVDEWGSYDGFINIPLDDPKRIYLGFEAPLDDAWIRRYPVLDSGALGDEIPVAGIDSIQNRRPNSFASFASDPGVIYSGLEGGLIRIHPNDKFDWVWKSNGDSSDAFPYLYIQFIWSDPAFPGHLIFGGNPNGGNAAVLETRDGGKNVHALPNALGIRFSNLGTFHAGCPDRCGRGLFMAFSTPEESRVRLIHGLQP